MKKANHAAKSKRDLHTPAHVPRSVSAVFRNILFCRSPITLSQQKSEDKTRTGWIMYTENRYLIRSRSILHQVLQQLHINTWKTPCHTNTRRADSDFISFAAAEAVCRFFHNYILHLSLCGSRLRDLNCLKRQNFAAIDGRKLQPRQRAIYPAATR